MKASSRTSRRARQIAAAVPRDPPTRGGRARSPRSAADSNPADEFYTDQDKPLVAGSREARALHKRPPKTKGTLAVGTAGDAARPAKPGIHNKPIPRRGKLS